MAVNRAPRDASLLAQISKTNPFLERAQVFFGIGNSYDRDLEEIAQYGRLSPEGKREKVKARRQEALGKLLDLQKPIDDHRKQSESMRAGMKAPSYDKADVSAAMLRRELRDRSLTMTFGQRTMRMTDKAFRDAVLEMPPWVSGFNESEPNELALYETAKQSQLRELNGPLLDALEARGNTEAEIMMIANIVTTDVKGGGMYQAEIQTARDAYVAAATA
jgi:hypothetical protein